MDEQQPDNHPDLQDLLTWAEGVRQPGIGGNGLEIGRSFMPDPDIEAYFKTVRPIQKLLAALFPFVAPQMDPETIRKKYIKVFLILLFTSNGRFIASFLRHDNLSDQYLPFKSRPNHFPPSTADPDFFTSFYRRQWEFCARTFEYAIHQQLDEDLILPIIYKKKLGGGGSAVVHQIKLHPAYDKLSRQGHARESSTDQNAHTFVLKTYNTPDAERYYNNEVKGFLDLSNGGAHNASIVGFHGSFVWNGTYNVLLEYADRGTLAQFFDAVQPPSSGEDLLKLWREIFRLLGALAAIHSVQPSDSSASSDSSILQGWHQDIKPSNILVKSKKGGSSYDCEFKLADLGLSHFKRHVPTQREAIDRDTYGTRAYGAPECYRADNEIEQLALLVKQGVDIWSLGCIFSEIAVWVVHGKNGLSEYRRRRGMETAQIHDFRDGDCFHNGEHVLATVTDLHRTLARDKRLCDHVTGATVEMVTKEMLIEPDSRTPAKSLNYRIKGILRDAEIQLGRSASYADTGSVCGTDAQSPPRTPPEPPPNQIRSRSSKSHGQRLPSHTYGGSPASTSYYVNGAHHLEPVDYFSSNGLSQQTQYSDRPIQRSSTGSATFPSFAQCDSPSQIPETHLDRSFSGLDLSQDSPSGPSRHESPHTQRTRRWTPSNPFSGTDTRNDRSSQDTQENYNDSQRSSLTAARGGPSRSSTSTLVQGSHNSSRAGPHRSNVGPGTRSPRLEAYVPLPEESQQRRRPPFLSLSVAQHWKGDRKQHKPARLPDQDLLADLSGRDHVFLIDNTVSMRPHRKDVFDLFGLLGYMVKGTDPDGIELRFTMSRDRGARAKDTGPLLRTLDTAPFSGESNIRTQLGEILQDYHAKLRNQKQTRWLFSRASSPRPIRRQNIYIFTDGVWQPGCDPTDLIRKLVNGLESYSMEREQFGIQFIRFGDNAEGINRLNQLDSGLGLSMDIVDTEPWNGNIWKMLLGPINPWFDDDVNANSVALASPSADTSPEANAFHHLRRGSTQV